MYIAERLRQLREAKNFSQGDIENRTGLLRCYISRIENGHTVPSVETLEKVSRALEVPMYQLFYEGAETSQPEVDVQKRGGDWASHGRGRSMFLRLRSAVAKASDRDRALLLVVAAKMVSVASRRKRKT
jgi:transcriptional regulator with XRE-family HTH domain